MAAARPSQDVVVDRPLRKPADALFVGTMVSVPYRAAAGPDRGKRALARLSRLFSRNPRLIYLFSGRRSLTRLLVLCARIGVTTSSVDFTEIEPFRDGLAYGLAGTLTRTKMVDRNSGYPGGSSWRRQRRLSRRFCSWRRRPLVPMLCYLQHYYFDDPLMFAFGRGIGTESLRSFGQNRQAVSDGLEN